MQAAGAPGQEKGKTGDGSGESVAQERSRVAGKLVVIPSYIALQKLIFI